MRKINNKILAIALLVLVAAWVLTRLFRTPTLDSNLRKELVSLDTAAVTEIRILPSNARESVIKLTRAGNKWTVEKDQKKFDADASSARNVLELMGKLQADRMVSRKKEKWESFNVGEKSTNVSFFKGTDQLANVHIGKSGFNQSTGGMYGGGPYTYIRLSDEDEVYVVNSFLESTLNRPFSDWRDRSFLRIPKDLITKVAFTYPADSSFVIEKKDSVWVSAGRSLDKAKVEMFLGQLSSKNLNAFAEGFAPTLPAEVTISVQGASGNLGTIEAWKQPTGWTLRSSQHNDIFFSSAGSNVDKELLVGLKKFQTN